MCNWEKLINVQISFGRLYAKYLPKFLCKTCAFRFVMSLAFQKAKIDRNLTTESGSKQWFSLLLEKVVIQTVCLRIQEVSL